MQKGPSLHDVILNGLNVFQNRSNPLIQLFQQTCEICKPSWINMRKNDFPNMTKEEPTGKKIKLFPNINNNWVSIKNNKA